MTVSSIGPQTKVAELLEAHPEAEEILIGIAPQFKALKNPVLRRTVAKVATLEQAARVAGIAPRELVIAIRSELGMPTGEVGDDGDPSDLGGDRPEWVALEAKAAIDGGALLEQGQTPVAHAATALAGMSPGEVLVISAPFQPAPLIDSLRTKGHEVFADGSDENWKVWVRKKNEE